MNIVLVEPEIPQNTGNIARTCAATGTRLHLIEPLGFSIDDKHLKRAGLDYWHMLDISVYTSLNDFYSCNTGVFRYLSTKAACSYDTFVYGTDDYLIFGCETRGLPEALLRENYAHCMRIPMKTDARSLNLSNAVAVVLYEALRQNGYAGLEKQGSIPGI